MSNSVLAPRLFSRADGGETKTFARCKLVLLGESAVGKSAIVLRFAKGEFTEFQELTVGAAYVERTICLDDTAVKIEIWDTGGSERFHAIAPMYYRGAHAAIVVYDITKAHTFARAMAWVRELQHQACSDVVIALAGNKSDLAGRRTVEYLEAKEYAEANGLIFMETSAKESNNVNEIFLAIARKLPRDADGAGAGGAGTEGGRRLGPGQNGAQEGSKSCCNR